MMTLRDANQYRERGRPRSFDPDEALEAAMRVFWAQGYEATTYPDLEKATGLRRQSLRYAFGDKHSLFRQVLNFYAAKRVGAAITQLEAKGSPVNNIHRVFKIWQRDAQNLSHPGCLLVNTAGEFGASEAAFAEIVNRAADRLVQAFAKAIRKAQEDGELQDYFNPGTLARLIVSAGDGALLHARARSDAKHAAKTFSALKDLLT